MPDSTRRILATGLVAGACLLSACDASNNPVLGRVEANLDGHDVVVADCYLFSIPKIEKVDGGERFRPCSDSDVILSGDSLYVNGSSYGDLERFDRVIVTHGKVKIVHSQDDP